MNDRAQAALPPHLASDPVVAELTRRAATACERTPDIACVLLFGSRARGDHRPGVSDYDIAIIARDGRTPCGEDDSRWRRQLDDATTGDAVIDARVIPMEQVRTHGALLGNTARELLADGIALSGAWDTERLDREAHEMTGQTPGQPQLTDDQMIENHLEQAAQLLKIAASARLDIAAGVSGHSADVQYQRQMAKGVELWAKAVCVVLGVSPAKIHRIPELASKLESPKRPTLKARRAAERRKVWAKEIAALNGEAEKLNESEYGQVQLQPLQVADKKFVRWVGALREWLAAGELTHGIRQQIRGRRVGIEERVKRAMRQTVRGIRRHAKALVDDPDPDAMLVEEEATPTEWHAALGRLERACMTPMERLRQNALREEEKAAQDVVRESGEDGVTPARPRPSVQGPGQDGGMGA